MDRREFSRWLAAAGAWGAAADGRGADATGRPAGASAARAGASIAQIQQAMAAGQLSGLALTEGFLRRIDSIDRRGPTLRSVIEVNPQATRIAAELDRERREKGPRGPLHGIPILLKDNIATGDRMQTTAGSKVLEGAPAPRDATLVAKLRAAGAVILGKTNLSEWANIRSTRSTSGWSTRGGLTRNPYALDRNASGSSSGSAVAVAADLAVAAIGTETDGSIVSPASICGVVGLKPTVGLVSRAGIVPISHTQDTAGPMTGCVADAAVILAAMAGADPADSATAGAPALADLRALDPRRLAGRRLGVARGFFGQHDEVNALIDRQIAVLQQRGAVIVDALPMKPSEALGDAEIEVLLTELQVGLERYLRDWAPQAPVKTLADVVEWNRQHRSREMAWFGQELFEQSLAKRGLDQASYREALATCRRLARTEGLDAQFAEHKLDAIIAPTGGLAWLSDFVNGDHYGASFSTPAAVAGYPHLTVPAGFVRGLPVGLSFVGPAFSEPLLLSLGLAFEQATQARRAPTFPATLKL